MDIATLKSLESTAKGVLDHIVATFKTIESTATAQAIEAASPEIKKLAERALAAIPVIGQIEGAIEGLTAAYALAQALGLKPMDANEMAAQEAKFHEGYSAD